MIKLAIALYLSLGACASGESLEASIVDRYDRTEGIDVYVPRLNRTYSVNAEDYAYGMVAADALTCEADTLTNMVNDPPEIAPPESMRVYVGGCRELVGADWYYPECWVMRGCETLHGFDREWLTAHGLTF